MRQCMKQLKNWTLSGSEIPLAAILDIFPPSPHTFPYVSPIVSPVSLGISHVSLGVSPYLLFYVLRILESFRTNQNGHSYIRVGFRELYSE